jgi:hypothetical protein
MTFLPGLSCTQAIGKRTIDYSGTYVTWIQARRAAASLADLPCTPKPRIIDSLSMMPPCAYLHLPASNIPSKFVNSGFTKGRNPIMTTCWTPGEGEGGGGGRGGREGGPPPAGHPLLGGVGG